MAMSRFDRVRFRAMMVVRGRILALPRSGARAFATRQSARTPCRAQTNGSIPSAYPSETNAVSCALAGVFEVVRERFREELVLPSCLFIAWSVILFVLFGLINS